MKSLAVDASRARATLGWRNRLVERRVVGWTADWHGRVRLGETARAVSLDQIDAYGALGGRQHETPPRRPPAAPAARR